MRIVIDRREFDMPPPVPQPGEQVIHVSRYHRFRLPANPKADMFRFSNPLAKAVFFAWREGLRLTWFKARSAMLQRTLIAQKALVLVHGRLQDSGAWAVGVGPVDWPECAYQVFPSGCVATVNDGHDPAADVGSLKDYFHRHPDIQAALYYWSPYAGVPVPIDLAEIMAESGGEHRRTDGAPPVADGAMTRPLAGSPSATRRPPVRRPRREAPHQLFMAGAGAYAYAYILPMFKGLEFHSIIDLNPALAAVMAHKFGFRHRDTDCDRALQRLAGLQRPVLVVATYHSTHLDIAETALAINPRTRVIIEKPPVTSDRQLGRLLELRRRGHHIDIGYNRRFAPFTIIARQFLGTRPGPTTVTCIVREKTIPPSHWYYWPTQGTRITGNVSHWIDLGQAFIGQSPVAMTAEGGGPHSPADEASISVRYQDGSRLNIIATDTGSALRGIQEYIDIRRGDVTIQIDDFQRMRVMAGAGRRAYRRRIRDKGHLPMYRAFFDAIVNDRPPIYGQEDLARTTGLYLAAADALMTGNTRVPLDTDATIRGRQPAPVHSDLR